MGGVGRDVIGNSGSVAIANVDGQAQGDDREKNSNVRKQTLEKIALHGSVRGESEHDDDACRADGDGEGEGVEDFFARASRS